MRPTTDILSNNILIEALRAPEGLKGILADRLPRTILPAFLHEVTHHWCFLSPIAVTIATLRARSDEDMWRAKTKKDVERAAHLRVAAETLGEVYRPLSEGLALFAQHHLRMEPAARLGLAAEPLDWTMAHFRDDPGLLSRMRDLPNTDGLRPEDIPDELFEQFCTSTNTLLDETRTAESQIEDIKHIAMSRLDAAGEGYLPGLLLMKRGFNRIARLRPDLAAPTTFLVWAKEFLFHDTKLALDAASGRSSDTFARLRERLALFESDQAADMVEKFAELASTTGRSITVGGWPPTLTEGLDLLPGGDEALHTRLGEVLATTGDANSDDLVAFVTQYRSIVRDFVLLGRVKGELRRVNPASPQLKNVPDEVCAAVTARMAGFLPDPATGLRSIMFVPITAPLVAPSAPATLDLLFWSSANRIVAACYVDRELVGQALNSNGLTSAGVKVAKASLQERRIMEENIERFIERAREMLDWTFKDFDGSVRSQLHDRTDTLLRERLFDSLGSHAAAAFERFRERGLYDLFDTIERPTRFAHICAAASCGQRVNQSELEDMLVWGAAQKSHLGFPLLCVAGDLIQTAL